MDNKTRTTHFAKVLALILWGLAAIATSAAVWNALPGGFLVGCALINLLGTVWAIATTIKTIYNEED